MKKRLSSIVTRMDQVERDMQQPAVTPEIQAEIDAMERVATQRLREIEQARHPGWLMRSNLIDETKRED